MITTWYCPRYFGSRKLKNHIVSKQQTLSLNRPSRDSSPLFLRGDMTGDVWRMTGLVRHASLLTFVPTWRQRGHGELLRLLAAGKMHLRWQPLQASVNRRVSRTAQRRCTSFNVHGHVVAQPRWPLIPATRQVWGSGDRADWLEDWNLNPEAGRFGTSAEQWVFTPIFFLTL